MKAEHRKELQTNVLADQMGRLVKGIRSGPKSTTSMVWVVVLLALGTFVVWRYYASAKYTERSSLWVTMDRADGSPDPKESWQTYETIAQEHRGTIPARIAHFQIARMGLADGIQNFASSQREEAIRKLVDARALYQQLARQCTDAPLLAQEARMGMAVIEETLIGVPNPEDSGQPYGTLDRAIDSYRQLAAKYPDSFQGKAAAARVEELAKRQAAGELGPQGFYTDLNTLAVETQASGQPSTPSRPELPFGLTPELKPDSGPELKFDPKPEAKSDPKPAPKLEAKPETKAAPKLEAKPEVTPEAKPQPKADAKEKPKAP